MASIFRRARTEQASKLAELRTDVDRIAESESETIQQFGKQLRSLSGRLDQIERELAPHRMRTLLQVIHRVAHLQISQGVPAARAIATGLQAVVAPPPPGVAGGIARVWHAWRHDDRTFMSHDDEERIEIERRERMVRGGRARARGARRTPDGRFLQVLLISVPSSTVGGKAIMEQQ